MTFIGRPRIHRLDPARTLERAEEITALYAAVFGVPPWSRPGDDPEATRAAYARRLDDDARRPGFGSVVAADDTGLMGYACGWTTAAPWRTDRGYPKVRAALGSRRVDESLIGRREIDELAVRPEARGLGLGRRLLRELAADEPCWLLTYRPAVDAVAFYRRCGWVELESAPDVDTDIVVFASPVAEPAIVRDRSAR